MREEGSIISPTERYAGLYVHIPFCATKCGFCDFYSSTHIQDGIFEEYFQALSMELDLYFQQGILEGLSFNTIYVGGGTPSLVPLNYWEIFLQDLEQRGLLSHIREMTFEMNPEDVHPMILSRYREWGVNRISLGIQSFDSGVLANLGRRANALQNIKAIEAVAREFENFSLDFMYGISGQDVCTELFSFGTFQPPHISTYMLTLYPHTPFYLQSPSMAVSEEKALEFSEDIEAFFLQSGYHHYEISNFAKEGRECLHNQHYWGGDLYLGLGAGASGYLGEFRYTNAFLKEYLYKLHNNQNPWEVKEYLVAKDKVLEGFLLRLRTRNPLALGEFLEDIALPQKECFLTCLKDLAREGFFQYDQNSQTILPCDKTWQFSDWIAKKIYNVLYN